MAKVNDLKGELIDSSAIAHGVKELSTILNENLNIVDITQTQDSYSITSKIPFDDERVFFFVFIAKSSWSNHICPPVIFYKDTSGLSVFGNWENGDNSFEYNNIFVKNGNNKFTAKKFRQTGWDWTNSTPSNPRALGPYKIYAVMRGVN